MSMNKHILNPLKIGFIGIIFILSNNAFAKDYYVNALEGSDSNSGTSKTEAWKTINKVNTYSFKPGDIIYFKKGQTFNGQLVLSGINGTSDNPITFTSYGTTGSEEDKKPVISVLTTQKWSDWTKVKTNIYKRNMSSIRRLGQDGKEILKAVKINYSTFARVENAADPLNSQFRWHHNGSGILYLYSETNPNNSYFTYTKSPTGIRVSNSSHLIIDGLYIKGGGAGVLIADSSYITIKNCKMGEYSVYGIQMNKGQGIRHNNNIVIDHNIIDSKLEDFDYNNAEGYPHSSARGPSDGIQIEDAVNCTIKYNYVKNFCHTSMQLIPYSGVVEHNKIYNNTFTAPNLAYGGRIAVDRANYNEFHHNLIVDTAVVSQLNGRNNHYHHNYFDGTRDTPLKKGNQGFGMEIYAYGHGVTISNNVFEYNTIMNCDGAGFAFTATGEHDDTVKDNEIKNNIFYNNGKMPRYSSGSYRNMGIFIEMSYDNNNGQIITNNAIHSDFSTKTIGFAGSQAESPGAFTPNSFNDKSGKNDIIIAGNIDLYPSEDSTKYGAGPRKDVGAGAEFITTSTEDSVTIPKKEEVKTGAFIMDPTGLH